MTSRERLLAVLNKKVPDVMPVTTHHVMPYYLKKYQNGMSIAEFFDKFGMDAINWFVSQCPNEKNGEYVCEFQGHKDFLESTWIMNDNWRYEEEIISSSPYPTKKYTIKTPKKDLTLTLQSNEYTSWIVEHPIKEYEDIDILAKYLPKPIADIKGSEKALNEIGDKGIVRTHMPVTIDFFGQPGVWQDACCMYGTEPLIMKTFDDPGFVHELLQIILERKLEYTKSLLGAKYDIIELGGGDGCVSVISPTMFDEFVAPYDKQIIDAAHEAGQKISYHLCGSIMPILDSVKAMGMDAFETLTPPSMGADADLKKIKEVLGDSMCLIGGFDQNRYFTEATEEETRTAVKECFELAGENGGYIISPSDHFFDAKDELLHAFANQAHKMKY